MLAIFALLCVWGSATSCVETAECDQTSPCREDGTICFDYECLDVCEEDTDCDANEQCASCLAQDACFGQSSRACVELDTDGAQ